jgi:hypothetical protein
VASNMHARTLPVVGKLGRMVQRLKATHVQHVECCGTSSTRGDRGFNGRWYSTRGADDQCWNPLGTAMLTCREQYKVNRVSCSC